MKKILLLAGLLVLGGCAVPAKEYTFDNSREYQANFDEVWGKVIKYFAINNIEIKTLEKESGIIAAENGSLNEQIASCRNPGAFAILGGSSGRLNVFVEDIGEKSKVTVNTKFQFTWMPAGGGAQKRTENCNSTGYLETQILDYLDK